LCIDRRLASWLYDNAARRRSLAQDRGVFLIALIKVGRLARPRCIAVRANLNTKSSVAALRIRCQSRLEFSRAVRHAGPINIYVLILRIFPDLEALRWLAALRIGGFYAHGKLLVRFSQANDLFGSIGCGTESANNVVRGQEPERYFLIRRIGPDHAPVAVRLR